MAAITLTTCMDQPMEMVIWPATSQASCQDRGTLPVSGGMARPRVKMTTPAASVRPLPTRVPRMPPSRQAAQKLSEPAAQIEPTVSGPYPRRSMYSGLSSCCIPR